MTPRRLSSAVSWLTRLTPPRVLEGAHGLMVLVLDPAVCPGHRINSGVAVQRDRPEIGRDALACRQHGSKVRHRRGAHATCLPRFAGNDEPAGWTRPCRRSSHAW